MLKKLTTVIGFILSIPIIVCLFVADIFMGILYVYIRLFVNSNTAYRSLLTDYFRGDL